MTEASMLFKCGGCKLELLADNFNKNKGRKSGLDRLCRPCKRQVYLQNRDARCAQMRESYQKNAERERERSRRWRQENREQHLQYLRDYRSRNLEERRAADRDYAAANREEQRAKGRKRYASNRGAHLAKSSAARAERLLRAPSWLTPHQAEEIAEYYRLADYIWREVGVKYHVDHIIPLRGELVSGLHVPWNLRVIPYFENIAKGNRVTETLLRETESFHQLRAAQGVATEIAGHDHLEETDLL